MDQLILNFQEIDGDIDTYENENINIINPENNKSMKIENQLTKITKNNNKDDNISKKYNNLLINLTKKICYIFINIYYISIKYHVYW